jgi:hypothetical protein
MKYRKSLPFLGVPGVERFEMESSGYVQRGKKPRRKFWVATSIFWKFGKEANLDELNTSTGLDQQPLQSYMLYVHMISTT